MNKRNILFTSALFVFLAINCTTFHAQEEKAQDFFQQESLLSFLPQETSETPKIKKSARAQSLVIVKDTVDLFKDTAKIKKNNSPKPEQRSRTYRLLDYTESTEAERFGDNVDDRRYEKALIQLSKELYFKQHFSQSVSQKQRYRSVFANFEIEACRIENGNMTIDGDHSVHILHCRTIFKDIDGMKLLIDGGADIHHLNSKKQSALHLAMKFEYDMSPELLDETNNEYKANLCNNCKIGNLLRHVNVNVQEEFPLDIKNHISIQSHQVMYHLVETGLYTQMLSQQEIYAISNILIQAGININQQDENGNTALHYLASLIIPKLNISSIPSNLKTQLQFNHHTSFTALIKENELNYLLATTHNLLQAGANPHICNNNGFIPLDIAISADLAHKQDCYSLVNMLANAQKVIPDDEVNQELHSLLFQKVFNEMIQKNNNHEK